MSRAGPGHAGIKVTLNYDGGLPVNRKILLAVVFGAVSGLSLATPATFGQEQQKATPKLQVRHAIKPAKTADAEQVKSAVASGSASKTPMLPLFTYNVDSDRDGNEYTGVIVGANPFTPWGNKNTQVKTFIVPLVIITNTVGVSFDPSTGVIGTAPGVTVFDPTKNDNGCLAAPNNNPLKLFQHSPIFDSYDISIGGTDMGHTQYEDAHQRAEFWDVIEDKDDYHVLFSPIVNLSPIVINVPAAFSTTLPPADFPACGPFGIVDVDWLDTYLNTNVLPALQPQVNAGNIPFFMMYNTVMAGPVTNLGSCCILGYHGTTSVTPLQAYSPTDFDTTGLFGPTAGDSNTLSHEAAEFINDPYGNNPTPAWGGVGQVPPGFCQNNLEVGDPLTGLNFSPIGARSGFTYHLQELTFFSWFYSSQSIGIHGWFSNNDTFTADAGPACVPAGGSGGSTAPIRIIGTK
jgi:hypothetical protein